jgi:hypothetical protein
MRYLSERDAIKMYEEYLNDVFGNVNIAGLEYTTSYALKEVDPTAYHQGYLDFLDNEGITTDEDEE